MARIGTETITVATTGADGSATGSGAFKAFAGFLLDVYLAYTTEPATTDVTIAHTQPTLGNILVVTSSATDALYPVRVQAKDAAGAAITGVYDYLPVDGILTMAVAQGDDPGSVTATIRYLEP
jgi:hypothetical protein